MGKKCLYCDIRYGKIINKFDNFFIKIVYNNVCLILC